MEKLKPIFQILFISVLIAAIECRKYDIEEEAMKLYGEDLRSVIRRFRRTPEYLSILKVKLQDLKDYMELIKIQLSNYYINQIAVRCVAMLYNTTSPTLRGSDKNLQWFKYGFKMDVKLSKSRMSGNPSDKSPVELLDSYFKSSLTLEERNMFKALGFEFAGKYIHSLIKSMGKDSYTDGSTRYTDDAGTSELTTGHNHEIISTRHAKTTQSLDPIETSIVYKKYRFTKVNIKKSPKAKERQHLE